MRTQGIVSQSQLGLLQTIGILWGELTLGFTGVPIILVWKTNNIVVVVIFQNQIDLQFSSERYAFLQSVSHLLMSAIWEKSLNLIVAYWLINLILLYSHQWILMRAITCYLINTNNNFKAYDLCHNMWHRIKKTYVYRATGKLHHKERFYGLFGVCWKTISPWQFMQYYVTSKLDNYFFL